MREEHPAFSCRYFHDNDDDNDDNGDDNDDNDDDKDMLEPVFRENEVVKLNIVNIIKSF